MGYLVNGKMVLKLSPSMKKVLGEMKSQVLFELYEKREGDSFKVRKKATKKKTLLAFIPFAIQKKPMFQLFINERFYGTFFYNLETNKWHEETNSPIPQKV